MKYTIKDYEDIRTMVENMTEEELLCSVTCPYISDEKPYVYKNTAALFIHGTNMDTVKERIEEAKTNKNRPLIVTDIEGAVSSLPGATKLQAPMRAVANSGEERLAYEMGRICAEEALPFGYHWGLGPCVDITGNSDSPIVNTRTPGRNTEDNIKFGTAKIRGMQDYGLIATAKHFPGDGYCAYDQHLTTTENPLSYDEWMDTFGKSYKAFIDAGLKSIMPGHISLPCYDDVDEGTGLYRPATLSRKLMTDLLKKELGFEGIIITDAVNMGGFCGYMNFYRACAECLEAGADSLLFAYPDEKFLHNMHEYIKEGVLSIETLKDRAYRMWCFAREHVMEQQVGEEVLTKEEREEIARDIGRKAAVVERDRYKQLPLKLGSHGKLLVNIISISGEDSVTKALIRGLKEMGKEVDVICDAGPDVTVKVIEENHYDAVICYVNPAPAFGTNTARLAGPIARNMMGGWQRLGTPIVYITGSVGMKKEYESVMDILINTNGSRMQETIDTIICMILG